jgi:hypothetical protein
MVRAAGVALPLKKCNMARLIERAPKNKGEVHVNHKPTGADQRMQRKYRLLSAAVLLLAAWPALAEVDVTTSATARYEYNSNVWDLQSGFPVPGTTNDFQRSDNLYTYGALLDTA